MLRRKKASTKLAIKVVKRKKRPKKTVEKKSAKKETAVAKTLEKKKSIKRKKVKRARKRKEEEVVFDNTSFQKADKEKRLIMWSGVTFFMILVIVFWMYNIKQVFVATEIESKDSEFQIDVWKEAVEDISSQISEIKEVVGEIKEVEQKQKSTLPTNDSVEFVEAATSTEVAGTSTDVFAE